METVIVFLGEERLVFAKNLHRNVWTLTLDLGQHFYDPSNAPANVDT